MFCILYLGSVIGMNCHETIYSASESEETEQTVNFFFTLDSASFPCHREHPTGQLPQLLRQVIVFSSCRAVGGGTVAAGEDEEDDLNLLLQLKQLDELLCLKRRSLHNAAEWMSSFVKHSIACFSSQFERLCCLG